MAGVADDLAFLRDHGMSTLGTGIEEFLGLWRFAPGHPAHFEKGRQSGDGRFGMVLFAFHVFRLSRGAERPQ